tara:strand:+ start:3482 stop:3964 length:483 start_codon:yes stop_codon:yes gene_type:complete
MTANVGDKFPSANFFQMTELGPAGVRTDDLFTGKKVVLFAVPGAFTPTCSAAHLPGFVVNADAIKAKGVDEIVCMSVNDPFVMMAWGKAGNADAITMVADPPAEATKALGLDIDLSVAGLGVRSKRFAIIVDNGIIVDIAVENAPPEQTVSSAESVLGRL